MSGLLQSVGYPSWVLGALLLLPALGTALLLLGVGRTPRVLATLLAAAEFLLSLPLWFLFNPAAAGMQFTADVAWIPQWGIHYRVGIDGISLMLVLLTTFLMPLTLLASFRYIRERERSFYALMLLLEAGVLGVFVANDLFLFFMFWEIMLVPMYFIIGLWGGQRRVYAAIEVLPLHDVRLTAHAGGHTLSLLQVPRADRRPLVRLRGPAARAADVRRAVLAVRRVRSCLRHQGPAVPVPHLAARCARGGTHARFRDSGRRSAETGRLRLSALPAAVLPAGGHATADRGSDAAARTAGHHVRRHGRGRAAGCQEADRVHIGGAHGLRGAGRVRGHDSQPAGRADGDAVARTVDRRHVPAASACSTNGGTPD